MADDVTPTYLTTNQSEESPWAIQALLLKHCDSSLPSPRGTHILESTSALWSHLPVKAIKLFLSTLPKILSQRFNLATLSRSQISATMVTNNGKKIWKKNIHTYTYIFMTIYIYIYITESYYYSLEANVAL